jgi:hypothetical protein
LQSTDSYAIAIGRVLNEMALKEFLISGRSQKQVKRIFEKIDRNRALKIEDYKAAKLERSRIERFCIFGHR